MSVQSFVQNERLVRAKTGLNSEMGRCHAWRMFTRPHWAANVEYKNVSMRVVLCLGIEPSFCAWDVPSYVENRWQARVLTNTRTKISEFFLKKDIYAAEDMGGKNSDGVPMSCAREISEINLEHSMPLLVYRPHQALVVWWTLIHSSTRETWVRLPK